MRRWVKKELGWTERKATRAAQKIPDNWEDVCEQSTLRIAYQIKEFDISEAAFFVNTDQTQVVFAPGDKLTYAPVGAKQVSLVGGDEKRAFTVLVAIASDGTLLPFQVIYEGKSERSCPSPKAPHYDELLATGARLEFSGTKTYWSNIHTMQLWVDNTLAPYFNRRKQEFNRPESQRTVLQWDVWSVHRSEEMRTWMRENHPTILVDYVPGGCTGVHQACDVGIQRSFKHSIKRSYHQTMVEQMLEQMKDGKLDVAFDKRVGVLRDQSVGWLWDAFNSLNKKDFVKRVRTFPALSIPIYNFKRSLPGL